MGSGSAGVRMRKRLSNLLGMLTGPKPQVGMTPMDVVHRENKWRLLRYRARSSGRAYKTPILLVPSLINRHYVLDLAPGRSFVEYLVGLGHDVFIIDWGTPGSEDRYLTFDDICDRYLGRAVRKTCWLAGSERLHLLGYCLGGTLTTIYTAARPEFVASMVAMAAPIDFRDDGLLSLWTRGPTFDVDALVDGFGNVPWPLMQASFHMLKPTMELSKKVRLIERAWDDEFLDGFRAIERWGTDNVSFPGECYRQYINELYRGNALINGSMRLGGDPARLEAIRCGLLVISFEHDHIVPPAGAEVLLSRVSSMDKQGIRLRGGHVGAVISRKAAANLWPTLSQWWIEREDRGNGEIHRDSASDPQRAQRAR